MNLGRMRSISASTYGLEIVFLIMGPQSTRDLRHALICKDLEF